MKYTEEKKLTRLSPRLRQRYDVCRDKLAARIQAACHPDIFHYTSAEGFHNIISNKQFFFTDVAFLNDSTEMANVVATFSRTLEAAGENLSPDFSCRLSQLLTYQDFDHLLFGDESDEHIEPDSLRFFVLACSFRRDSLNMWNYYTGDNDSDGGYNIAFDRLELTRSFEERNRKFYGEDMLLSHGKIIYCDQEKEEIISGFLQNIDEMWQEASEKEKEELLSCIREAVKWLSIFYKHECFAGEEEYRIVLSLPNHRLTEYFADRQGMSHERLYKIRFTNNMFTPYVKLRFDPKGIRGVCLSPLCEKYTTEYKLQSALSGGDGEPRDVLQYGVHEFLRINGYELAGLQIRRSSIPLRF